MNRSYKKFGLTLDLTDNDKPVVIPVFSGNDLSLSTNELLEQNLSNHYIDCFASQLNYTFTTLSYLYKRLSQFKIFA